MSLRRSLLFVPGSNRAAIENASESIADIVVIDLEDAVSMENKDEARETTLAALEHWDSEMPLGIRINGVDTSRGIADLERILEASEEPAFLVLPDVRGISELRIVASRLDEADSDIELLPLIEQPSAVFEVHEIANGPRVYGLLFAAIDFQMNMGMSVLGDSDISLPRYLVSMAASSAGIPAFDTPLLVVDDEGLLRTETAEAKVLGYDGKLAVNTQQAAVINDVLTPSEEEVAEAQAVIDEFEAAEEGLVDVGGTLVDKPVIDQLRDLIERAEIARANQDA
jgi:citrate lyase beta subunit